MTYQLSNPLRAVLRYMRGDDIKESNQRAIALSMASRASGARADAPATMPAPPSVAPPAAVDRRRM